jgi:hypothetical protein
MKRELFLVFKITKICEIHAIELALLREREKWQLAAMTWGG